MCHLSEKRRIRCLLFALWEPESNSSWAEVRAQQWGQEHWLAEELEHEKSVKWNSRNVKLLVSLGDKECAPSNCHASGGERGWGRSLEGWALVPISILSYLPLLGQGHFSRLAGQSSAFARLLLLPVLRVCMVSLPHTGPSRQGRTRVLGWSLTELGNCQKTNWL